MRKHLTTIGLVLIAAQLVLFGVMLYVLSQPIAPAPAQLKPVTNVQPYGGCDEAARYPDTPGHAWCVANGYLE
jgi:hypothetical protein